MNVAVLGAGAIGGWVAAKLALAGNRVAAIARGGPLGRIRLSENGQTTTVELDRMEGPQDLLILAVKAPALADAADVARGFIGPETAIIPMLNGVPWWFLPGEPLRSVDPDGRIDAALPLDQVVGCVVHASCRREARDHVVVNHAEKLILGEPLGGASEGLRILCALFEEAGIRCEASENVRRAIWYKLWGNATINPLSALTRSTADRLLDDPAIRAFMLDAMEELAAVGAAVDCPISESGDDRMAVTARLGAFKPSMLQDVEAGRPIELEALLGAPREIAGRAGVPTPQLDRIYAMTRLMAESLRLQ